MHTRTKVASLFFLVFLMLWAAPAAGYTQGVENLFEAGKKAFQDGLYVMAGRNFRQLVDQYPDSPLADDADYLSGVSDFYLEEFRSCIAALDNYAGKYPRSNNNRRVSYWLGSAHFQLQNYPDALSHLKAQVEKYPDEQPYFDHSLLLKGMVEENLSNWAAARSSYGRLLERESAQYLWPEALYRVGGIALRFSDYSEALTAFARILIEFPNSQYASEAVFFVGECNFFLGRYAEAERSYRTVLAAEPPPEQQETGLYRLAIILAEQGRGVEALEFCDELELRFPRGQYIDLLIRLKADMLFDLERYDQAFAAYSEALAATTGTEERQVIYHNMGLSAFLNGNIRRSIEPLEKALQGRSEISEQSLFRLAAVLTELGSKEQAVLRYEEFRKRFPASQAREEATRMLASLYQDGGDLEQAEGMYTELITRYPDSPYQDEYLFKRGSSHLQRDASAAALSDFFSLTQMWPNSPYIAESRYNIGYIYSRRGEYKRALPFFEQALKANPSSEPAGRSILAAGVCAFNAGEYSQAIQWFGKNTASGAAWAGESWFYLGRTHYKLEQLEDAAGSFARAAELLEGTSQGEEALFWKGLCQFRLDRLIPAKETFLMLTALYPGGRRVAESYYRAGICASQLDSYPESIDYYDKALQAVGSLGAEYRDSLNQEILYQKGFALLQSGERDRAVATYETLSREYPNSTLASEAFFKIAEEDFRVGNYRNAERGFLQVRKRFPASPAAGSALYWAGVSAARDGMRVSALEYLIGFLEENPGGDESAAGGLADVAIQEIRTVLSGISSAGTTGQSARSEQIIFEDFYRRVDRSPSLRKGFKDLVRFEYARFIFPGRPEGSMAILQTLRTSSLAEPLRSEVNYLIGEYYRINGELDRAYDIFTGIIAASSEQPGAASQLAIARVLEDREQKQEAAEEYLKVHFLYPDQQDLAAEGLYGAGRLYWDLGLRDRAEQLFEILAAEYPDSPWLEKLPER
ncbi:MAG: tetratricopeptide repeat protein [Spirochaetia bacterium]